MKRDGLGVQTKTTHFAETVVSLSKKAVAGAPAPAYRPGKEGYADWVILTVQDFKEYLGHDYRKLMDVLREMPSVADSLVLTVETLPHYSTVCARKQAIPTNGSERFSTRLSICTTPEISKQSTQPASAVSKRASTTRNAPTICSRR